ncbi:MAG: hypothetical protein AAF732_12030 [Pseudomonadota bacterium]
MNLRSLTKTCTRLVAFGAVFVFSAHALAQEPKQLCVAEIENMPESWKPSASVRRYLNPAPWSPREAKRATLSIGRGVDEMINYFKRKPSALFNVGADSIEAIIQVTYASANAPELDEKARSAARKYLTTLSKPFLQRSEDSITCNEFGKLLPLAIFAHRLYPKDDWRTKRLTTLTNVAFEECETLKIAADIDIDAILGDKNSTPKALLDLYVWVLWFTEAQLFPDIKLPEASKTWGPRFWTYTKNYKLRDANEFEEGPFDEGFIAVADLAPHMAHLITATHRYKLRVSDAPNLYRWHRENFYAALEVGELDLFASVVDTLRQYGCTAENDKQVRDGTRYLLKVFSEGEDSWMDYRQDGETDENIDDYGIVHYPWTAILGVRVRKFENPGPDNLGGIVRSWN